MIRDDPCGSSVHKGPYKGKGTRRMRAIEGNVRSRGQRGDSRSCTDSFEKRKGPRAEGRRRPLDASKMKKCPLKPPERTQPSQHS